MRVETDHRAGPGRHQEPGHQPLFRRLELSDAAAIAALEAEAFAEPWSVRMIEAELQGTTTVAFGLLLTDQHDQLAQLDAYALFRLVPPTAELNRIAVRSTHRKRGLGSVLMNSAHQALLRDGATECFLEVRESNHAAIRLYRRYGYRALGRRSAYYTDGSDAVVMRGTLESRT